MNVAIIPARGGSKRLPGKNIRSFWGKPIIQYSIDAAIKSGLFNRVIVSTDSKQIADVAIQCGAEVPFLRPSDISDDFTPLADVVHHTLAWLLKKQESYEYACCIMATAPFIQVKYLKRGCDIIRGKSVSSAFTVTSFSFPIFRAFKITEEGFLRMVWPEHEFMRSNDLPETFHDAGQFYWLDVKNFLTEKKIYTSDAVPIFVPRFMVQDIDTEEDWEVAEKMYQNIITKGKGEHA